MVHPVHRSDRERNSRKCRHALSVPHSFSHSVSMRDYYINDTASSMLSLDVVSSGNTVVVHFHHHPKVKGLSHATGTSIDI